MQSNDLENTQNTPIAQEQVQPPEQNVSPESNAESPADINWKRFREERKKERAEKEAAEKRAAEKEAEVAALKAAMEAAFSTQNMQRQPQQNEYGYPVEETQEQIIEKKISAALSAREEQYRQEQAQLEAQEYPHRLQTTYADFNAVISQDNLDYLDYHYPEVSRPLQRLQNGYEKWSDIYLAIKKFVPNAATAKKEAARAEANFNKPKSMSSMGATQADSLPGSHILTKDKRQANWERMQKLLKGVS